jgi:hypothetical protein
MEAHSFTEKIAPLLWEWGQLSSRPNTNGQRERTGEKNEFRHGYTETTMQINSLCGIRRESILFLLSRRRLRDRFSSTAGLERCNLLNNPKTFVCHWTRILNAAHYSITGYNALALDCVLGGIVDVVSYPARCILIIHLRRDEAFLCWIEALFLAASIFDLAFRLIRLICPTEKHSLTTRASTKTRLCMMNIFFRALLRRFNLSSNLRLMI